MSGHRTALAVAALAAGLAPGPARAQTMLDQEERLIELHSLLLALPPLQAPGALAPWQVSAGLEVITIPEIDGTTGSKRQLTARDHTPAFPRPRVAVGLPVPLALPAGELRAFAGLAYVPPLRIRDVSTHHAAAELGLALLAGPLRVGARVSGLLAESRAPVTERAIRDVLETRGFGADLSAGVRLPLALAEVTPYAGLGVASVRGRFRVTSDGNVLTAGRTGLAWRLGARALARDRWELAGEWVDHPGRLRHLAFRAGYVFF